MKVLVGQKPFYVFSWVDCIKIFKDLSRSIKIYGDVST
jgi:hypothetical protein